MTDKTTATFADLEFDRGDSENMYFKGSLDGQAIIGVSTRDVHDGDHMYCGMLYTAAHDVPADRYHYSEGEEVIFDGVLPDMMKFSATLRFVKRSNDGLWVIDPAMLAKIRKGFEDE